MSVSQSHCKTFAALLFVHSGCSEVDVNLFQIIGFNTKWEGGLTKCFAPSPHVHVRVVDADWTQNLG